MKTSYVNKLKSFLLSWEYVYFCENIRYEII